MVNNTAIGLAFIFAMIAAPLSVVIPELISRSAGWQTGKRANLEARRMKASMNFGKAA